MHSSITSCTFLTKRALSLARKPFRVNVNIHGACNREEAENNARYCESLNLPRVLDYPATVERLAVCGSSPNLDIEALKKFDGDIWAVNGTAMVLAHHKIPFTMVSIDPFHYDCERIIRTIFKDVERAILARHSNPILFDFLKGKDVKTFNCLPDDEDYIPGGTTTASRAAVLALKLGYKEVHFFGLEGSFSGQSHLYKDEVPDWHKLKIVAGENFNTCVELMTQSHNLASFIKRFPNIYKDRSGGLLAGMVEHFDTWEVTEMSDVIRQNQVAA